MLKKRHFIIYILLVAIILGPIAPGMNAFAEPVAAEIPAVITDTEVLAKGVESAANGEATFVIDQQAADKVTNAIEAEPEPTKVLDDVSKKMVPLYPEDDPFTLQGTAKDGAWSTFQSFVTTWTLLGIAAAHKRAHDQNLTLTPENQKKIAEDLGADWDNATSAKYSALESAPSFVANTVLTSAYKKALEPTLAYNGVLISIYGKILQPILKQNLRDALRRLFKYFVSGAMLSIGTEYIRGIIIFSAQEVLDHPDKFGGVDQNERGALKLLQSRAGFAYYISGLYKTGDTEKDPKEKWRLQVFHSIDEKVKRAMKIILKNDDGLRNALFAHLWRQAFLQGRNGLIIAASIVSDIVSSYWIDKEDGWWEKNGKSLGTAIGVGFLGSLVPDYDKDLGTAGANTEFTYLRKDWQYGKFWLEFKAFNFASTPDEVRQKVEGFLEDEAISRQNRFTQFAYIMKLALDRSDSLLLEKDRIQELKAHPPASPVTNIDWVKHFYNLVMGWDWRSEEHRLEGADNKLAKYHEMFSTAASNMLKIYADDGAKYKALLDQKLPADVRYRVQLEQRNLLQMTAFGGYLDTILDQRWSTADPSLPYFGARHLLEQISFWGIHEQDILRVFSGERIVYQ